MISINVHDLSSKDPHPICESRNSHPMRESTDKRDKILEHKEIEIRRHCNLT